MRGNPQILVIGSPALGSAVAQALEYLGLINGLEGGEGTEMWANADSAREE